MGLGYWCFATNVALTIFNSRLVKVPKPQWHLWKYFATGAAALTVGTVQGVIQVQPAHADWLYKAGHAGEWIDPISHAHINLVTGLTMLVAGSLFRARRFGRRRRALSPARQPLLLRTARRLARFLCGDALPGLPRGWTGRPPGPDPGAGGGSDTAAPVPDHGRRDRDVRGFLAAARRDRPFGLALERPPEAVRARRVRGACGRDAAGTGAGVPGRQRAARPRRPGRRRDRQPARSAEHARRADGAVDRGRLRRPSQRRGRAAAAPRAVRRRRGRRRCRRLLRLRRRFLGPRGRSGGGRRFVRVRSQRARALGGLGHGSRRARRAGRLLVVLAACRLDDRAAARRGTAGDRWRCQAATRGRFRGVSGGAAQLRSPATSSRSA